MSATAFANLDALAAHLRNELGEKKFILLYAYNGTGKTRVSMAFKDIGKQDADDIDGILHTRIVNILSHGNYSLYEPQEMLEENKAYFRKILDDFRSRYAFNPELFPQEFEETE